MEDRPEGNYELQERDIFNVLNPYFLLLFSLSCILSSVFIQEIFIMLQKFRIGITLAPTLGMILPIVLLTRRFPSGFTRQLMIRKPPPRMTLYVVLATFAAIVVIDFIYILSLKVMPAPEDYVDTLRDLKPDGALSLIITGIGLCVAVPVAEEIIFRGVIQRVFARSMGGVLAAVLAGVFFGVIHLNLQLLISMTVFGIYLGFLFMLTSNLIYTVFAHAILNSIAFVQLIFAVEEDMTTAPFYLQEYWMLAVGLALLGVFLAKIKKEASENDSEATRTGLEDSK